jgi:hypothetical protein
MEVTQKPRLIYEENILIPDHDFEYADTGRD